MWATAALAACSAPGPDYAGAAAQLDQAREEIAPPLGATTYTLDSRRLLDQPEDENRSLAQSLRTTPWGHPRTEWPTARARSVAARTMPREAFLSRQTPRDRGRRSDRHAGGEDGRRPDNPHGRRAAPHRGRIRARGHDPNRAHRSDGRRCSCRGSRVTPRSRARRHDLRAGGEGDHRAGNRCGRRDARRSVHNLGRADAHGRNGWGRSKSS